MFVENKSTNACRVSLSLFSGACNYILRETKALSWSFNFYDILGIKPTILILLKMVSRHLHVDGIFVRLAE